MELRGGGSRRMPYGVYLVEGVGGLGGLNGPEKQAAAAGYAGAVVTGDR